MKRKSTKTPKKQSFMQSVLIIMFSQIIIKLLGLIYTLYLTNREGFGDKGNAIYASGYQIYALLLTISSIGVPNAISKIVSEKTATGDHKGANRVFKVALATFALIGLIGTLLLFFGAHIIANYWLEIPEAETTLVALSPAIFFVATSSVMRGYFNGRKSFSTTARAQTLEQIFKTVLTILIVEIVAIATSTSTKLMAAGANLATTLATLLSFSYLVLYYKVRKKDIAEEIHNTVNYKHEKISQIVKKVLMVSIPMTISAVLSSINKNVDSFTVKRILSTYLPVGVAIEKYGILGGKVDTLTGLPLSVNIAFATALVPAIAEAKAKKDMSTATRRTTFSLLVSMLIGLPCTIGMCVFAGPILKLLYPNASNGAGLLQIASFTIIFSVLNQTINGALQGYGKVMVPASALGIGVFAKFLLNITLLRIPEINVYGAAIGSVVCQIVAFSITFIILRKNVKLNLNWSNFVIKPIIATLIMIICSYAIYIVLGGIISTRLATIIAILIAIIVYVLSVVALKIFTKGEIMMIPYGTKIYSILEKIGIY